MCNCLSGNCSFTYVCYLGLRLFFFSLRIYLNQLLHSFVVPFAVSEGTTSIYFFFFCSLKVSKVFFVLYFHLLLFCMQLKLLFYLLQKPRIFLQVVSVLQEPPGIDVVADCDWRRVGRSH